MSEETPAFIGRKLWSQDWPTQSLILRCLGKRELRADAARCARESRDVLLTWHDRQTRKAMTSLVRAPEADISREALAWVWRLIETSPRLRIETWEDSPTRTAVLAIAAGRIGAEEGVAAMGIVSAWAAAKPAETFVHQTTRDVVVVAGGCDRRTMRQHALSAMESWFAANPEQFKKDDLLNELCDELRAANATSDAARRRLQDTKRPQQPMKRPRTGGVVASLMRDI